MRKILVIDDEESILEAVCLILEDVGYKVETVFKGEETYEKVAEFKPDLIFLDVLMSGSDGRTICQRLKTEKSTKQIPIVMISAHPSAKKNMEKYCADGFLAKPFGSKDLLKTVLKYTK